jgi:hypothetical protein
MELALLGDTIIAEQAKAWGLVNRVVEPGATLAAAIEATRIAGNAPLGVAASKQLLRIALDLSEEELWRMQDRSSPRSATPTTPRKGPASLQRSASRPGRDGNATLSRNSARTRASVPWFGRPGRYPPPEFAWPCSPPLPPAAAGQSSEPTRRRQFLAVALRGSEPAVVHR